MTNTRGTIFKLLDTQNNEITNKTLSGNCKENEKEELKYLDAINYKATETGTYTFVIDTKKFVSITGNNIGMITQNKIKTIRNGVETYGNVWAKTIRTSQGSIGDINTQYTTVDKNGNSYEINLENYNGIDSTLYIDNIGNGSKDGEYNTPIDSNCLPSYNSGGISLENIDRTPCDLEHLDNKNIFIDTPATYLPEISPNDYDGETDNSYINPTFKKVEKPEFNVTTDSTKNDFQVKGIIKNFQGFVNIDFDYNGDGVFDDNFLYNVENEIINQRFKKKSNVEYIEQKAKTQISAQHIGEIHFVFFDVEKSGQIQMKNIQTGESYIYYNEDELNKSQICDSEVDFKGEIDGIRKIDSATTPYGWENISSKKCDKPWDLNGLNSLSYGDGAFVDLWSFNESQKMIETIDVIEEKLPELKIDKRVKSDVNEVESFSVLNYEIEVQNVGEGSAYDVLISDPLDDPAFTDAKISEAILEIDGKEILKGDIKQGLQLDYLEASKSAIIKFDVEFANIQNFDVIKNTAIVDTPSDNQPPIIDEVVVDVIEPILELNKTADQNANYSSYSTINYSLNIKNKSKATAKNILVKDSLSSEEFENSKISIAQIFSNGKIIQTGSIQDGITIKQISPDDNIDIKFSVELDDVSNFDSINNIAFIDDPNDEIIINEDCYNNSLLCTTDSPHVDDEIINLTKPTLKVNKKNMDDNNQISNNDVVKYKVEIENDSEVSAYNVFVKDLFDHEAFNNAQISEAQVYINDNLITTGNIQEGITIDEIKSSEIAIVNFDVKFEKVDEFSIIKNTVEVSNPGENSDPIIDSDEINVDKPNLVLTKNSNFDSEFYEQGDTINYELLIENTSNSSAYEVLVKDSFSSEVFSEALIGDAEVYIDNVLIQKGDIKNGIIIPELKPHKVAKVIFNVSNINGQDSEIINIAFVDSSNDSVDLENQCLENSFTCNDSLDSVDKNTIKIHKNLKIQDTGYELTSAIIIIIGLSILLYYKLKIKL